MMFPIDPDLCADLGCRFFKDKCCTHARCAFPEEFGLVVDESGGYQIPDPNHEKEIFSYDELFGDSLWED